MRIYGTYRPTFFNQGQGMYTPSYVLDQKYSDYKQAGLTNTLDLEIPENRYTTELVPGIKKLTRFIIGEYDETVVNGARYKANIATVGAEFNMEMFATPQDAIIWIKANTDLVELTPGVFEIHPKGIDPITKKVVPQKTLNII